MMMLQDVLRARREPRGARAPRRGGGGAASGQSLTEFALIAPILLLVIMIIVDFGRVAINYNALTAAARTGAEYAGRYVDPNTGRMSGVNVCTYVVGNLAASDDPRGQCQDVLTHALVVAPQVPRGDIASIQVQRNGASSDPTCRPIPAEVAQVVTRYCLTLAATFHPVTGMILGGRAVPLTVNAQYLAETPPLAH